MFSSANSGTIWDDGTICAICSKPATKSCANCKSKLYCSKPCQKSDWKVHKKLCSKFLQFSDPPHENARRAILFETDEASIKFVWVDVEWRTDDEDDVRFQVPKVTQHFRPKDCISTQLYHTNILRNRKLAEDIVLRFRDTFLVDGSPVNRAVASIAPATIGHVWRGPLVALKHKNSYLDERRMFPNTAPEYAHMDMRDFRSVVDYLTTYGTMG